MRTKRSYQDYLRDIWEATLDIEEFMTRCNSYDDFKQNKLVSYAVRGAISIIGEASKHIPLSIRTKHAEIPWTELGQMRNKFVHEYFGVNLQVIWETATVRLPDLKPKFAGVLEEVEKELFDKLKRG